MKTLFRWWKHLNLKTVVFSLVQHAYVIRTIPFKNPSNAHVHWKAKVLCFMYCKTSFLQHRATRYPHLPIHNDSTYNITEWAKRSARGMLIFLWLLYHDSHFSGDFFSRKAASLCQREQRPNQNLCMILFLMKTLCKYN